MSPAKSVPKNRTGMIATLSMAALSAATAVVYAVCYGNQERYMSWPAFRPAFILLLVGAAFGVALTFVRRYELGAACMAVTAFSALMLFIKIIYMYVVVVYVGIDLKTLDPRFVITSVFFILCFIASLVTVFLPQVVNKEGMRK